MVRYLHENGESAMGNLLYILNSLRLTRVSFNGI
jgi:hypothetical protein